MSQDIVKSWSWIRVRHRHRSADFILMSNFSWVCVSRLCTYVQQWAIVGHRSYYSIIARLLWRTRWLCVCVPWFTVQWMIDSYCIELVSYVLLPVSFTVNCVALLLCNVGYYALYVAGHPLPPEPVSLPRSWHKLTFLCWRAVKQSIDQPCTVLDLKIVERMNLKLLLHAIDAYNMFVF